MYLPWGDCTYYKTYQAIFTQIPNGFIFQNSSCEISYGFEQITVMLVEIVSKGQAVKL